MAKPKMLGSLMIPGRFGRGLGRVLGFLMVLGMDVAVVVCAAAPVEMVPYSERFLVRTWGMSEGLPGPSVTALAQTADGYIWVATQRGLARFDGNRFTVFGFGRDPEPLLQATALAGGFSNRLWVGRADWGVSAVDGAAISEVLAAGTIRGGVVRFVEDDRGRLWIEGGDGSISVLENGVLDGCSARWSGDAAQKYRLLPDGAGGVLIASSGGLWKGAPGPLVAHIPLAGAPEAWICAGSHAWRQEGGMIYRVGPGTAPEPMTKASPPGWCPLHLKKGVAGGDGILWVGTVCEGLLAFLPDGSRAKLATSSGLGGVTVLSMMVDRNDHLWVGLENGGLSRVQPAIFTRWDSSRNIRSTSVAALTLMEDGVVAAACGDLGVFVLENGFARPFLRATDGDRVIPFTSLASRQGGGLLGGTQSDGLMYCYGEKAQGVLLDPGLKAPISVLRAEADGSFLIGRNAEAPLLELSASGQSRVIAFRNGPSDVRALCRTDDGWLWIGTETDGLFRWKDGTAEAVKGPDGAMPVGVRSIIPHGGALWVATAKTGIWRYQAGSLRQCRKSDGLPSDEIFAMAPDRAGAFWCSAQSGFFRVEAKGLADWFDGGGKFPEVTVFGESDGIGGQMGYGKTGQAAAVTPDGDLWFTSSIGVVQVHPDSYRKAAAPGRILMEEVRMNGVVVQEACRLKGEVRRAEFHFTLPGVAQPDGVRYEVRLAPQENKWTPIGSARSVDYQNLRHGEYVFEVRATDRFGQAAEPTGFSFRVMAPVWLRPGFWVVAGGILAAGIYGALRAMYRAKMRSLQERMAIEAARQQERARIARDMHDQLGAGLAELVIIGDELRKGNTESGGPERVAECARELVDEMNDSIWAINPRNDTWHHTVGYLSRTIEETGRRSGLEVRIRSEVNDEDCMLPSALRQHLLLATREAVTNVIRHAGAKVLHVTMEHQGCAVEIRIEDDGRGFPDGGPQESGNGLRNMRQRMAEAGGTVQLGRSPQGGASVILHVPAPAGGMTAAEGDDKEFSLN
jgi:signal transduction histidine kinase/ligand-binding sensor domain-containing protein